VSVSTVLVVQADPELNRDWCAAVEASGHTVISALGVDEGVRRVREGGIDLVLVDHLHSDGALTEFVGALDRLPDPPPFVLISDSPRAPEISAHLGAAAFLPKPCPVEEIISLTHRFGTIPVRPPIEDEPTQPRIERLGRR
jgi:two-component system, NtrC family, response regulator